MLPTRGVGRAPPTRCRDWGVRDTAPTPCRNRGSAVRRLRRVVIISPVATATTEVTPRTPANRPSLVSVGTIVWLSSELMFFAALFAMYFTARAQAGGNWPPAPTELNLYQA